MKVRELIEVLTKANLENEVKVCINEPPGWICPDGAAVGLKMAIEEGIDWHQGHTLLVPEFRLDIANPDDWRQKEEEED